jgi:hypothetical protein
MIKGFNVKAFSMLIYIASMITKVIDAFSFYGDFSIDKPNNEDLQ